MGVAGDGFGPRVGRPARSWRLGAVLVALTAAGAVAVPDLLVTAPLPPAAVSGPVAGLVESDGAAELVPARSVGARGHPGTPRHVAIPAIGTRAEIEPIEARERVLVPPDDPWRVGWWADGARPGDRTGTAVLTGHAVHGANSALGDLADLSPGEEVTVTGRRGAQAFSVRSVATVPVSVVSRRYRRLFRQSGRHRLVLITCDDWDGEVYRSSVVVIAVPVR